MITNNPSDRPFVIDKLGEMRAFFDTGETRSLSFRKQQLVALRNAILSNEAAIIAALQKDLHKSTEEGYSTEIGLLLSELRHTLKNIRSWSAPVKAKTTLANLPSTSRIYRDPLGVVLVIAPWNYPFQLALMPMMAAIAAGNCVVMKPSEKAPATSALIAAMMAATFPPNYVLVAEGAGEHVIPEMIKAFRFDHIFYTGNIPVGKIIYKLAAEQLVPVTLELGGKSPVIIEPDADLMVTARRVALGKWLNAGQTCIAPDYVLVHESVKDIFISELGKCIRDFYTNNPAVSYDYGRIINVHRFDTLVRFLDTGRIVYGGDHDRDDLYIGPTIIDKISADDALMKEEIFGPVLPVITYRTTAEAMAMVRKNPDPLALYLFTKNDRLSKQWIEQISFGGGCINNTAFHFSNYYLPFGGVGSSGMGAYHGKHSFDLFSREKSIMTTPFWFDPRFKYPSFRGKLSLLKRIFR
jgi:aldehyde dehydrogenase (NAD+)